MITMEQVKLIKYIVDVWGMAYDEAVAMVRNIKYGWYPQITIGLA